MIITQEKSKQVVQSHDFDSVNCTIDAEDMRYVASLLRNNYSNPTLAVVREISANALDANAEANASDNIEVTIPSSLNPHFVVRDFGGGLSQEQVFNLYSKYGKSTKRESNNYIGAFGIGKFAPLSYGSNFTCISYNGGLKTSYNIFVNEDDDTKIVKLHEEPTSEPTGLSVEVAVSDEDVNKFREVCKNFFRFFTDEEMPKFIGVGEDEEFFDKYEVVMESNNGLWFILKDEREYWAKNHHESTAIMGRVHYPIDVSSVNWDSFQKDDSEKSQLEIRHIRELASQDNISIRFDIGQLKLHHSRESLEYNKNTQKEIVSTLRKVQSEIKEIAKEKLGNAEDLWDAISKYAQVINALPHGLRGIFENTFEWEGIKVNNMTINRSYQHQDDLILTEYTKDADTDATDGYKCRSGKVNRIFPSDKTQILMQDLKSNHGNSLRARTLFKENENLDKVIVIYANCKSAEDYLFDIDGMQFIKINKERFKYTSLVEKSKLQSRGSSVSGESRAGVPLFEFDISGKNANRHRNADFWLNCNESIYDLELNQSDPTHRGLIYIPISNYKVVSEDGKGQEVSMELNALMRDAMAIKRVAKSLHEEEEGFEFPLVIGVRRKDCSKLDKSRWTNWVDYKKTFCQSYLLENMKMVVKCEKVLAFNSDNVTMDDYRSMGHLLDNGKFHKLIQNSIKDKSHTFRKIVDDLNLMKDLEGKELETITRMVSYMKEHESAWVEENIPSTYNVNEFNDNCKEVINNYPLLINLGIGLYSWASMTENNLGKNMVDYILMCDLVREGD